MREIIVQCKRPIKMGKHASLKQVVFKPLIHAFVIACFALFVMSCGSGGGSTPPNNPPPVAPPAPPTPPPVAEPKNSAIPSGGSLVVTANPTQNFVLIEGSYNNAPIGSVTEVDIDHPNNDKALEIDVLNPSGVFYEAQVQLPITDAVAQDDLMLLYVEIKMLETTDETGTGFVTAFVESTAPQFTKYLEFDLRSTGEWEEYFLPFRMGDSFDANQIALKFGFGGGSRPQKVQLTNIQLFNFKDTKSMDELPVTRPTYQGREADASWRAQAQARIEQHRKGDLTVTIKDSRGQAVSNAQVSIEMQRHAYHFGSVATVRNLLGSDANSITYREKLLENFNQSGIENGLKWPAWAGDWGEDFAQQKTIDALQYLADNNLYSRGHVMVWPSKRNMPEFVQQYMPENAPQNADAQVLTEVENHIQDISEKTTGLVQEWDVLNEPFDNFYLMEAFGDQVMPRWFDLAEQFSPNAQLYINDYSIISANGTNVSHQDHYFNTIAYLLDNNAPLHGIGVQSHFSQTPTSIELIYTIIDRFHQSYPNLAIRSTEFDVDTSDEEMQSDYTRDFLTIFFSHPATVGVQKWGFWAGAHWRPRAAMYDLDWRAKPNQQAWHNLIYDTWWSSFDETSNGSGEVSVRGFYGDYSITVTTSDTSQSIDFSLLAEGPDSIEIILE